ncbi:MAG: SBBP repeat-containing protein [Bacteroidota bacterium]|nr:SBBP repeat-containing protein [Bacteroidota bacterium]MDP3145197.1 SBBP repeat-containing protein [Bacteroidota bacterium]
MKRILFLIISLIFIEYIKAQTPAFHWAKGVGGSAYDGGNSIVSDANGNIYTVGNFAGTIDFDPSPSIFNLTAPGNNQDVFILKLDASGNFVWAKNIGGTYNDQGLSCAIDASGNIYITGTFGGTVDFDPGIGIYNLTTTGTDIFILKLDNSGNFSWAKNIGGIGVIQSRSIAVDVSENVYVTGYFDQTKDFDPNAGVFNLISAGGTDVFILKLNQIGNLVWAKKIGGTSSELSHSIAIDVSGNVYSTGYFRGTCDFDPGIGIANLNSSSASDLDIFISKLDALGNYVWAKQIGSTSDDRGYSIAIDAFNNVYTVGTFSGTVDFDPGVGTNNLTSINNNNWFISKLNSSGDFLWAKNTEGTLSGYGFPLAIDTNNNIYTIGQFNGVVDFDPGSGVTNLNSANGIIFITKYNNAGDFLWATNFANYFSCTGISITTNSLGNIYTTGDFSGTIDCDPGPGTFSLTSNGLSDIFIHKMSQPSVGIKENDLKKIISIYPNPSTKIINVELEILNEKDTKIQILNLLGQVLIEETPTSQNFSFNIQNFPNGLYFLKMISDGNIIETRKIVKE